MEDPRPIVPLTGPVDATVAVPGSKSLTNRALVAAALAEGASVIDGALFADDTAAMAECLTRLRARVVLDPSAARVEVGGTGGELPAASIDLDARLSGTTARFVAPLLTLGPGHYRLDGAGPLRGRPMGDTTTALAALGATVEHEGRPGHLPMTVSGGPVPGGAVTVAGDASSQFLSGLLLAGPAMADGLTVTLTTELVSRPFVAMTASVMEAFGAAVDHPDDRTWTVRPGGYRSARYRAEPDATAASYFLAAAAICGGTVRVEGLGAGSLQGDIGFVDVLARMGATVELSADATVVTGTGRPRGGDFDLSDMPDTAQTLAVMAVFADRPTRVTGVGFIRQHETDRIAAIVAELSRCGIVAREEPDGFVVHPGSPRPAKVRTYDDHRMAMSFALLGLRAPGIEIADPGCVAKTFPRYFAALDSLRRRD
jgi:3-phosphoshikimate 1-carboxyvinyltransferase